MWSMGAIIYALLEGTSPFSDETQTALFKTIKTGSYKFDLEYSGGVSNEAKVGAPVVGCSSSGASKIARETSPGKSTSRARCTSLLEDTASSQTCPGAPPLFSFQRSISWEVVPTYEYDMTG